MLQRLCYLALLLINIAFTISASPPDAALQVEQVSLPTSPPAIPFNLSTAVQTTNGSEVVGLAIGCFGKDTIKHKTFIPIRYMDCYTGIARALLLGDDVMVPERWTKARLPYAWKAGSCQIILDAEDERAVGDIQMAEIAHVASMVTLYCVTDRDGPKALGGQAPIGSEGQFMVTLFGRKWP